MTNLVWMTSFRGSGGNAAPPFALGPRFVEIAATPATSASQEEEADMTVRITRPRAEPRNGSIRTRTRLGFRIALLPLVFALFVCFALLGCSRDDTDPTRLDFDPLGLGQLVQFNPALTRAARIAPNHRIMTGRCAIGVPQACQNGKARIFSKV